MASTFASLTVLGAATSLFRHWALVIVISSLLSTDNPGYFVANAEPTLSLHGLPALPSDLVPGPIYPNSSAIAPISTTVLKSISFDPNPLATVHLGNVSRFSCLYFYQDSNWGLCCSYCLIFPFQLPNIEETRALLRVFSRNDSASNYFVLELSNPPPSVRRTLVESKYFCLQYT